MSVYHSMGSMVADSWPGRRPFTRSGVYSFALALSVGLCGANCIGVYLGAFSFSASFF